MLSPFPQFIKGKLYITNTSKILHFFISGLNSQLFITIGSWPYEYETYALSNMKRMVHCLEKLLCTGWQITDENSPRYCKSTRDKLTGVEVILTLSISQGDVPLSTKTGSSAFFERTRLLFVGLPSSSGFSSTFFRRLPRTTRLSEFVADSWESPSAVSSLACSDCGAFAAPLARLLEAGGLLGLAAALLLLDVLAGLAILLFKADDLPGLDVSLFEGWAPRFRATGFFLAGLNGDAWSSLSS